MKHNLFSFFKRFPALKDLKVSPSGNNSRREKLSNSFLSIFNTRDLFNKMEETQLLWEKFITKGTKTDFKKHVRNDILESWERCQKNGVNPRIKQANEAMSRLELDDLLTKSELYQVAKPIIDNIFLQLAGTGYMITLNNEEGKMIYLKGEPNVINQTRGTNFCVGMDWSEGAAGTNAIGTSLATQKPIQIFAAEHYCEGFHSMTCSSAPIFQPYTNKVVGVVDFTGLWENGQPHTLAFAMSIAKLIENELLCLRMDSYNYLAEVYYQQVLKRKSDLFLVINTDLVVINSGKRLMDAFNIKKMINVDKHSDFGHLFNKARQQQISPNSNFTLTDVKVNGFVAAMILTSMPIFLAEPNFSISFS